MQDAFGIVIFAVVGVAALVAIGSLIGSGKAYSQIGKGGLSIGDGLDRPSFEPSSGSAASAFERDEEIRQMLHARNARRVARGLEPVDVETELVALTKPAIDPSLRDEIRQMVNARNARRERRGEAPLDVEAEIERQIAAL